MNTLTLNDGITLHYRVDGADHAPTLLFSNSLGTDLHMWDDQAAALGDTFRIVRYDTRGHGASGVPTEVATIDRLGSDAIALLDHLGIERAHVCGLSLGGFTAQWIAINHPNRVERLVLSNTAARIGSIESWDTRISTVEAGGTAAIADMVLGRFFSANFHTMHPEVVARYRATLLATDPFGYIACCAAMHYTDLRPLVSSIVAPTLVIGSTLDESTKLVQVIELQEAINGSELYVFNAVAHISSAEQPAAYAALLRRFLLSHS